MTSEVNLHPERRRPRQETGTSKFFAPSTPQPSMTTPIEEKDVEMKDAPTKRDRGDDEDSDSPKRRLRQAKLVFSDGKIATKVFKNPTDRNDDSRKALAAIATETWKLLPGLLQTRPDVGKDGYLVQNETLDARRCPNLPPTKVRVISSDTVDAALALQSQHPSAKPVAILNMANAKSAGGGWKYGALAQEESICYRTSLILTLKHDDYPIPDDAVIYSPKVLVIRDNIKQGHAVVDCTDPRKLKVISVVSCAAVCQPSLKTDAATKRKTYMFANDKRLMLKKMRIILRTAIRRQHRQIILGAFGCGAFGNPNTEVSVMWKSVLQEPEFSGGYWEDVVFAVLGDSKADSNHKVFYDELDGLVLS